MINIIISKEDAIKIVEFYLNNIEEKIRIRKASLKIDKAEYRKTEWGMYLDNIEYTTMQLKELQKEKRKYKRILNKLNGVTTNVKRRNTTKS